MQVHWTNAAVRDFTDICDYVEQHSGKATAHRIALSVHTVIELLVEFPEHGKPGRKPNTRELVMAGLPYLAIYRIGNGAVEILRILHGAIIWP